MCELSLIDLGNRKANGVLATIMMRENSRLQNKDGCGTFNAHRGVLRSAKPAYSLLNLSEAFVELDGKSIDDGPILCHVRAASLTLANKLLTFEHAHPFQSDHYVFAHNGTLTFKSKEKEDAYKDKEVIDSEMFLDQLEKCYTGNVYEDLVTTMDLFRGKFAFLIYHIPEGKYYVVRGKTASLHYWEVATNGVPGIVINTEKDHMESEMVTGRNILKIFGMDVTSEQIIPKAIDEETVNVLDPATHKLVLLGKISETPKEVVSTPVNFHRGGRIESGTTSGAIIMGGTTAGAETVIEKLVKIAEANALDIRDLDKLAVTLMDKCLLEFGINDPKVLLEWLVSLGKSNNPKYLKLWRKMTTFATSDALYKRYPELSFPYFLTDMSKFKFIFRAEKELLKEHKITIVEEE
jgi:predicted glutamine amidotransferase